MDFEVSTQYTLDEQKHFHRALLFRRRFSLIIAALGMVVLTGMAVYYGVLYGIEVFLRLLPYTAVYAGFVVLMLWLLERSSVKAWKTKEITKDAVIRFRFTEDYVEVNGAGTDGIYTYDKFLKLVESKTHFYPMITDNMGFVIRKDACTTEQQTFIREKCIGRKKLKETGTAYAVNDSMTQIIQDAEAQDADAEEPLYTAKVKYTLKEYLKYNAVLIARNVRMYVMLGILLLFIMFSYYRREGMYGLLQGTAIFAVAIGIAFLLILVFVIRSWKNNMLAKNSEENYKFFADRIEVTFSNGKSILPYDKIYKIIETGQSFYIMVAQGQGLILSKSECTDELTEFIKAKRLVIDRKEAG